MDAYLATWHGAGISEVVYGTARDHRELRERFRGMAAGIAKNKR